MLGPRPAGGVQPRRLTELADEVSAAFGGVRVNPDSPADVVKAFARAGIAGRLRAVVGAAQSSTIRRSRRCWSTRSCTGCTPRTAGPGSTHWVRDGRFRPEYVAGGVVSGRWATRGGGALQIPHGVRRAVVADPG